MSTSSRDRDEDGRPRSARPRDALGRPLPPGSPGVPQLPEDLSLSPAQTLVLAQELLDDGRAFYAHEVFEAAWKSCPDTERGLWQGLAQLAVGITHIQRGNPTGARALLQRAARHLADSAGGYGIDAHGLAGYALGLADELAAGAEIPDRRLRPTLR